MSAPIAPAAPSPATAPPGPLDERTARELLQITRLMVAAAHEDDWDTVALHDTSRRELLATAPAAAAEGLPDSLTEALIAADRAVLERARRVRDVAVDDTHRVRAERDARDTYTRVMSDDGRTGS